MHLVTCLLMKNSFWLPQTSWDYTIRASCQLLYSQLSLYTFEQDLYNFPAHETKEVQESWIYKYILAHKLVSSIVSNFIWDFLVLFSLDVKTIQVNSI